MFSLNNPHNYVRPEILTFPSIEFFALIVIFIYIIHLLNRKNFNKEKLFFLFLPFSDVVFRLFGIQPVEFIMIGFLCLNKKGIKILPIIGIAFIFLLFSLISYFNPATNTLELQGIGKDGINYYGDLYSFLYSIRFALTALFFTAIINQKFKLDLAILKFIVFFTFSLTFLQVFLWLLGLPIDGIFFNGILPRAKGLAHEPATWSIWILSLFPYILHFRMTKKYVALNIVTLFMTFSTFGFVSLISYILLLFANNLLRKTAKVGFRIRKDLFNIILIILISLILFLFFNPEKIKDFFTTFSAIFEKILYYFQELSLYIQGQSLSEDLSGRSSDFAIFKDYFEAHWLLGIGSFKTAGLNASATNFYLIILVEIGVVGVFTLTLLLLFHYLYLYKKSRSIYFFLFSLNFLLMIAGIRCFPFHELWYAQANALRVNTKQNQKNKRTLKLIKW